MTRTWRIFWHEYSRHLTRRSYLFFTFGFPLFMALAPVVGGFILAIAIRNALPEPDRRPVGLVDQAALLADTTELPREPVEIIRFADPTAAQAALAQGQIQAIYDIEPDYWETGHISLSYETAPAREIDESIEGLVRQS
ncbi:MAG TPA: hypothetical protein VGD99_13240, partial [Anaerolineae bacterium]